MSSSDNKTKKKPAASKNNSSAEETYTVSPTYIPPGMRGKPIFLTGDFVLFPEDIAIVSQLTEDDRAVFEAASSEMFDVVIGFRTADRARSRKDILPHLPVGTLARIIKIDKDPNMDRRYTIRGVRRVLIDTATYDDETGIWRSAASEAEEIMPPAIGSGMFESQSKLRVIRQVGRQLFEHIQSPQSKEVLRILDQDSIAPGAVCDKLVRAIDFPSQDRARILNLLNIRERLDCMLNLLTQQMQVARLMAEIAQNVRADIDKQQRDYFFRQQIKALREQIGETQDQNTEVDELREKIEKLDADDDVREYLQKAWKRLSQMQQSSSEYTVARTHIETLLDIPWKKYTQDSNDIVRTRRILDEDHFGLEDVKRRLLEFLAVRSLKPDLKAPILCLYGPPGVGKTSLGQSVARALNRKFHRISLGGVHDESEIRGHRRTYVASMPGRIVQGIRRVQCMNPVIMLDEIDKISRDMHGDPSSALLEVLDPEQNFAFNDNYVETPINLSQVLFITTANSLDTIPPALRDRMEIIEIPGYTTVDKRHIAVDHLIPKLLQNHGLISSNLNIRPEALDRIISQYTHESGVRQLEQQLSTIMRKTATTVAEARQAQTRPKKTLVTPKNLSDFLGKPRYDHEIAQKTPISGVATGLAWTAAGGEILFIETTAVPGKGNIVMTGKLGDVMKESVRAALTVLQSRADSLGLPADFLENKDVHVHFPAGATPKDGPSAGCAIFCALMSLFTGKIVPADIAMTGEISLRGLALPIGGLREKILGAHRAGIKTVLFPKQNLRDLDEVPLEVRAELDLRPVETIDDVIAIVFKTTRKHATTSHTRKNISKEKTDSPEIRA